MPQSLATTHAPPALDTPPRPADTGVPTSADTDAERAAQRAALETDILAGLWSDPPTLPPRWFYDERGSRLFDEITRLPEYYPTRRETEILTHRATQIARTGATTLIELGAGFATKTRVLLSAVTAGRRPARFVPIDISPEVLHEAAHDLRATYPTLDVDPIVADFHDEFPALPGTPGGRLALFLGSTVGNFEEDERARFLRRVRAGLDVGDHFLLGIDLVKDTARLVAAYDDAAGVTAAFNRNVVDVIRRILGASGLTSDDFEHVALWDADRSRIEMRLRAVCDVDAHFPTLGRRWRLAAGETLRTEVCRKFRPAEIEAELSAARLEPVQLWTDDAGDYALALSRAA